MRNIIIGQSGGPTAVINASLYGVAMEAREQGVHAYGMVNGIEGFLEDRIVNLSDYSRMKDFDLLKTTPAAFLGSCRYRLPEDLDNAVYSIVFKKLEDLEIDAFFYIGGNDSMDTVDKLRRYGKQIGSDICFVGVPKTIDNDLAVTDHTPGYGSTAKFVAATVRDIVWDAGVYARPVVTIVELMGRNAGWVTAASMLARTSFEPNPMLIYLPEETFDVTDFIRDVKAALSENNSVVICVSEGIKDSTGRLICEYEEESMEDQFGHKMLAGCAAVLERFVKRSIGCKCRSIELNLPQRCTSIMISATDSDEAEAAGRFALKSAMMNKGLANGKVVIFKRAEGPKYHIEYEMVPVEEVSNKEKLFPEKWIINGNDISVDFLEYVRPLIQGENHIKYENGIPKIMKPAYNNNQSF